jgi:hypothetical protein
MSQFINIELPEQLSNNEEVMGVIRNAMQQIGYQYYNNDPGRNGSWVYHYAPYQKPVEAWLNEEFINQVLEEELSKGEVRAMIASELDDYTKNEKLKKTIKNLTADVLEDFLDSLWRRKAFWKGTIKRS